ncbi:Pao retrotransposon peptidase family protein-like [Aphelenchoides avenae]|nr:Pao retrotransposon peptidase family protein-like [Aphelenchus avenae]
MLYLLQHLRGSPLRLAEGFPLTDESFFDVIDLLEQRYGDRTTLQNALMQDVIDLPTPTMKPEDLQLFHDKAFRTIRNLRLLGPGFGPDTLLVQILLGKLPPEMRMKILQNRDLATLDANSLLKGVREFLSLIERTANSGIHLQHRPQEAKTALWSGPPGSFNQQNQPRNQGRPNTRHAQSDHHFYVAEFSTSSCAFCFEGHWANGCTAYTTAEDRIRRAVELDLCFFCLGRNHGSTKCHKRINRPRSRKSMVHGALHPRRPKPLPPVRNPSPFAAGVMDGLFTAGVASLGLPESVNFLNNGVPDAISPPIGTVPQVVEQPAVLGVRSAQKCEALIGNSTSKTTVSPERTAPGQGGTPRPTASSEARSQNPQGATAYGDEESLLAPRQTLSADNDSRTKTMRDASRDGLRTGSPDGGNRTPDGGSDLHSNEEVLIHRSSEATTCRASEPPASTSKRFTNVGYTAQPTPNSTSAVLLECIEVLASAPADEIGTLSMRIKRNEDQLTLNRCPGQREVIVFFDSGCSQTCVSRRLMESLRLPLKRQRILHVNSFGSRPPAAVEGTDTTITLWTTDYRPITFDAIALETTASQVTTALVEQTDLPLLNLGFSTIRPIRLQPGIVIGQDLVHLFDRQVLPRLPHGFYVVETNIGTAIGGAGQLSAARSSGPFRHLPLGSPALCRAGPQDQESHRLLLERSPSSSVPRQCDNDTRTPPPPGMSNLVAHQDDPSPTRKPIQLVSDRTEPPLLPMPNSGNSSYAGPTVPHEADFYFCGLAEVLLLSKENNSTEISAKRRTLPCQEDHPPQEAQNPLDTTEPPLRATTTTEVSTANSAPTDFVRPPIDQT